MYTKKKYSFKDMLLWTRLELVYFLVIASAVALLYEWIGLRWLQLPWTPIALIGTAVAFLVGFQSNSAYGRAWEARKIWGGIVNQSRSWGVMVIDMVSNEHASENASEEELTRIRRALIDRHIAWLTTLRYAMRDKRPWEVFTEHRTNLEWYSKVCIPERDEPLEPQLGRLLADDEFERVIRRTNKPAAILALQSHQLRALKERGLIWEFSFLELEGLVRGLFDLQGKSERIKNFPYPRQFATLSYDIVRVFIVLLPFGVIPEFASIGQSLAGDYPLIGRNFVWLGIPFTVILSWVFHTMQRIGMVGENPFEGSANDVPISTMARGIEIDLLEMIGEDPVRIPEQFPSELGVQM